MKMIAGLIPPDSGTITIGQTVKMGYYAQEIASEKSADEKEIDLSYLDPNQRVIDYVKERAEYIPDGGWPSVGLRYAGPVFISS